MFREQFDFRGLQALVHACAWRRKRHASLVGPEGKRRRRSKPSTAEPHISLRLEERRDELGGRDVQIGYMFVPQRVGDKHPGIGAKVRYDVPARDVAAHLFFLFYEDLRKQREKSADRRAVVFQEIAVFRIADWRGCRM